MTPEQIALVTGTSDVLLSVKPQVADAFYDVLFAEAPETRALFRSDMAEQKLKITNMLASLIGSLHRPDVFSSIIQTTARHHAQLGILPRHYDLAGAALTVALEASLGPRFTPDVRDAWHKLYGTIQSEMLAVA